MSTHQIRGMPSFALLVIAVLGCAGDSAGPPRTRRVDLEADTVILHIGQRTPIIMTLVGLSRAEVSTAVRDTLVAGITPGDSIVARRFGTTWLIAGPSGSPASDSTLIIATGIVDRFFTLSPGDIRLRVGESVQLTAVGAGGWNSYARFRSAAPQVAEVTASGIVSGRVLGNTIIIAWVDADSTVKATATVQVVQ